MQLRIIAVCDSVITICVKWGSSALRLRSDVNSVTIRHGYLFVRKEMTIIVVNRKLISLLDGDRLLQSVTRRC